MSFRETLLDDLDIFFDEDEFADAATLHAQSGAVTLSVILDYAYLSADFQDVQVDSRTPVAVCKSSLVEGVVAKGDLIDITSQDIPGGSATFVVQDHQPNGTGVSALILSDQ